MQAAIEEWLKWMGTIAAQGRLADQGNSLSLEGKVVRANDVTDGPYVEIKEALGGYIVVRGEDFEDVISIARECPIVKAGGNIEIRKVVPPQEIGEIILPE